MDRITAAEVFVSIVERGSMIAAARSLDISRSMVTRYLAEMEDWAGARVLHRSTRKLTLTPAGEQILEHCRQLLGVEEELRTVANRENDAPSGALRISCASGLADKELFPVFDRFLELYPDVSLHLNVANQAINLVEERIDLAIRITNNLDPNLIARKLGDCPSVLCAAPDYLERRGTPVEIGDLEYHNCLTYSLLGKSQWTFTRDNSPASVSVTGNLSANDPEVIYQALVRGKGIAVQPRYSVQPHLGDGSLVRLLPAYEPLVLGIYGLYKSRRHMSRALRLMIDMLVAHYARNSVTAGKDG